MNAMNIGLLLLVLWCGSTMAQPHRSPQGSQNFICDLEVRQGQTDQGPGREIYQGEIQVSLSTSLTAESEVGQLFDLSPEFNQINSKGLKAAIGKGLPPYLVLRSYFSSDGQRRLGLGFYRLDRMSQKLRVNSQDINSRRPRALNVGARVLSEISVLDKGEKLSISMNLSRNPLWKSIAKLSCQNMTQAVAQGGRP